MADGLLQRYRDMIRTGGITADPAQGLAVEKLQILANRLARYAPPKKTDFFSFFTRRRGQVPEGLYIFGGVGRGKTMLMDLFYQTLAVQAKRRIHFHEFMAETHELIARFRKLAHGDPVRHAAEVLADEAQVICFDELHVTDIADAMILGRLFSGLFARGTVIVATSNTPPAELYRDGLNRALFVPFITLIENRMEVLQLEAARDYRLGKLMGTRLYFSPLGEAARREIRAAWRQLTGLERGAAQELAVKGRRLTVPEAALGVARFGFADLCARPLGAGDYLAIAHSYHTVMMEDVPVMGRVQRDEARRFVTLIDTLYDNGVGLILSAEAEPQALYPDGDGAELFQRTVSRLMEMRSEAYLAARRGR